MATQVIAAKNEAEMCCPMCTHTVTGTVREVVKSGWQRKWAPVPGQKCPRCWTSLDAAFIVRLLEPQPRPASSQNGHRAQL